MAKTEDMTEEAHKSKKEPNDEMVDTLNEAEEKKVGVHEKSQRKVLSTSRKSVKHFL